MHPWQGGEAGVLNALDQLVIYLIRDNYQVMFFCDTGDLQQHFSCADCTGGIVWVTQQDGFCSRGDGSLYPFRFHLETVFNEGGDLHRNATREDDFSLVRYKTGCRDD